MKLHLNSATATAKREQPDELKQCKLTVTLEFSTTGEFPMDPGNERGTEAVNEEVLRYLYERLLKVDTNQ
jgi:hypothetical protein